MAANGKLITKIASATAKDVDLAVKAADKAFKTSWGLNVPGVERARLLEKLVHCIEKHADELAAIETIDCGKFGQRNEGVNFAHPRLFRQDLPVC